VIIKSTDCLLYNEHSGFFSAVSVTSRVNTKATFSRQYYHRALDADVQNADVAKNLFVVQRCLVLEGTLWMTASIIAEWKTSHVALRVKAAVCN